MLLSQAAEARHIAGGELSYEYLGPGTGSNLRYRITMRLYRDCFAPAGSAPLDGFAAITIYADGSQSALQNNLVPLSRTEIASLTTPGPCIDNAPQICYEIGYYIQEVELPPSVNGYDIAYQRCCRIGGITNIVNSINTGATYTAKIPGNLSVASAPRNSSPKFNTSDTVLICENNFSNITSTPPILKETTWSTSMLKPMIIPIRTMHSQVLPLPTLQSTSV